MRRREGLVGPAYRDRFRSARVRSAESTDASSLWLGVAALIKARAGRCTPLGAQDALFSDLAWRYVALVYDAVRLECREGHKAVESCNQA